jgi:hypothetical protein
VAATHLLAISQQGQGLSGEEVVVAGPAASNGAAGIAAMALAAATGDSTSAMLTAAESIDLKIGMRVSPVLVLTPCAALRYT